MKLKKIVSAVLAAVLSLSAVSALAAINVPTPKDNAEAYKLAEAFYHDGYYYEARAELAMVNTGDYYYDAAKQNAWLDKVNYKIDRYEVACILRDVKKLNSQLKFAEGLKRLEDANNHSITALEYYSLTWWEDALTKNLNDPKYAAKATPMTGLNAVKLVKKAWDGGVNSVYDSMVPVKVDANRIDVYVRTRTPDGTFTNIAAFNVYADGTVNRAF